MPIDLFDRMRHGYSTAFLWFLRLMRADPGPPLPTEDTDDGDGRWPSTREQFLWDLAPDDIAPNRDGVIPPNWGPPSWTESVVEPDEIERMLLQARAHRKDSDETTRNLELKAARLATVLVALLTANIALVVFEITRLGGSPTPLIAWLVSIGVILGLIGAGYLVVALSRAVDADQRMGITSRSGLGHVAHDPAQAMRDEAIGYAISDWTRQNKATRLINARAAVSRAMVLAISSAMIAIALAVITTLHQQNAPVAPVGHTRHHMSGRWFGNHSKPTGPVVQPLAPLPGPQTPSEKSNSPGTHG